MITRTIEISETLNNHVQRAAKYIGQSEETIIMHAIVCYMAYLDDIAKGNDKIEEISE